MSSTIMDTVLNIPLKLISNPTAKNKFFSSQSIDHQLKVVLKLRPDRILSSYLAFGRGTSRNYPVSLVTFNIKSHFPGVSMSEGVTRPITKTSISNFK